MGGKSSSDTTQNSTTQPWAPAQPLMAGILGKLGTNLGTSSDVTSNENTALTQLQNNANAGNPYADKISGYANTLLGGGGATDQSGNINANYQNYAAQTSPLASNTNYNPMNTPGFSDALNTKIADITNGVNGSFAAAGRDFSGANSQTLGRGISQGIAPTIAAQYNQNVQNQQGAASNLYQAGNTNSGLLAGLQQQKLANQGAGVGVAGQALDANNYGANSMLALEAQRRGIPLQALGMLANIGIPIAGLGQTSNGQSHTEGQMPGAQQFGLIAGGLGSIGKGFFSGGSGGGAG